MQLGGWEQPKVPFRLDSCVGEELDINEGLGWTIIAKSTTKAYFNDDVKEL